MNSTSTGCKTCSLHPPIRSSHIIFFHFISHFKLNSPTHNNYSKNLSKPKKKKPIANCKPNLESERGVKRRDIGGNGLEQRLKISSVIAMVSARSQTEILFLCLDFLYHRDSSLSLSLSLSFPITAVERVLIWIHAVASLSFLSFSL